MQIEADTEKQKQAEQSGEGGKKETVTQKVAE